MNRELVLFPTAFAAGLAAGILGLPGVPGVATTAVLWLLIGVVGVTVGADPDAIAAVRQAPRRLALFPVLVLLGSLGGAALLALAWPRLALVEALAVAAGVGYYSVTSLIASELAGPSLGVVALLANLLREALTLALAPVLVRLAPSAPVATGGATAMDTTLPVIARSAGKTWSVVAVYSGAVLTAAVPVVVPLILGSG